MFNFNGRTRESHMALARDHRPSRQQMLEEAGRRRQRREEEERRAAAATRVQRCARRWLAVHHTLRRCVAVLARLPPPTPQTQTQTPSAAAAAAAAPGMSLSASAPTPLEALTASLLSDSVSAAASDAHTEDAAAAAAAALVVRRLEHAAWCFRYLCVNAVCLPSTLLACWTDEEAGSGGGGGGGGHCYSDRDCTRVCADPFVRAARLVGEARGGENEEVEAEAAAAETLAQQDTGGASGGTAAAATGEDAHGWRRRQRARVVRDGASRLSAAVSPLYAALVTPSGDTNSISAPCASPPSQPPQPSATGPTALAAAVSGPLLRSTRLLTFVLVTGLSRLADLTGAAEAAPTALQRRETENEEEIDGTLHSPLHKHSAAEERARLTRLLTHIIALVCEAGSDEPSATGATVHGSPAPHASDDDDGSRAAALAASCCLLLTGPLGRHPPPTRATLAALAAPLLHRAADAYTGVPLPPPAVLASPSNQQTRPSASAAAENATDGAISGTHAVALGLVSPPQWPLACWQCLCAATLPTTTTTGTVSSGQENDRNAKDSKRSGDADDDAYLPPTDNGVAMLLDVPALAACTCAATDGSSSSSSSSLSSSEANGRFVDFLVRVAYHYMIAAPQAAPTNGADTAATAAASSLLGESVTASLALLDRLSRLLPFFLTVEDAEAPGDTDNKISSGPQAAAAQALSPPPPPPPPPLLLMRVLRARKRWLLCVSELTALLCRSDAYLQRVLHDLHHPRVAPPAAAAATTMCASSPAVTSASASAAATTSTTTTTTTSTFFKYRYPSSALFSDQWGLRLLERVSRQPGAGADAATVLPQEEEEEEKREDAATDISHNNNDNNNSSSAPQDPFQQQQQQQRQQQSTLEALCGVYAWPLYYFAHQESPEHQRETAAIFTRLTRMPALMRRLWELYRARSAGLSALLLAGSGDNSNHDDSNSGGGPLTALDEYLLRARESRAVPAPPGWVEAPAAALQAAGVPAGGRQQRRVYWEPHPALAVLFLTLLSHYTGATDFGADMRAQRRQGLWGRWGPASAAATAAAAQRAAAGPESAGAKDSVDSGTVLEPREVWALVVVLKEVVIRSHLYGVLPRTNSEAPARAAHVLLARLHQISELAPLLPFAQLWIGTTDQLVMRALGAVTGESWERLREETAVAEEARQAARARLQQGRGGAEGEQDRDGDDDDEGEDERDGRDAAAGARRGVSNAFAPFPAAAVGPQQQHRQQQHQPPPPLPPPPMPGDDAEFAGSLHWELPQRVMRLLQRAPFTVPFNERAALLSMLLLSEQRPRVYGMRDQLVVHRGRVFSDAFDKFRDDPNSDAMMAVRFAAAARREAPAPQQQQQRRQRQGGTGGRQQRHRHRAQQFLDGFLDELVEDSSSSNSSNDGDDDNDDDGDNDATETQLERGYGQGVYREFMVSLCAEGFAVEHGLFAQTAPSGTDGGDNDDNDGGDDYDMTGNGGGGGGDIGSGEGGGLLYPNPFSYEATGDPLHLQRISFLGAMAGRALRDGILLDAPFAHHFRNALLGRRSPLATLRRYDPELYRQLLSLRRMSAEELAALGLTFTYSSTAMGVTREVELARGGAEVAVTPHNCQHYVLLVADYKLNVEPAAQTRAFVQGLHRSVRPSWLQLFDSNELARLFGGDGAAAIDVADWRAHTTYHGGGADSPLARLFWRVVESLSARQQRRLLKFATSMDRPPLLGFRFLAPPFMLYMVDAADPQSLPTASTCFSTLKLPPYTDFAVARAKIIAAIEETNTFELS